ncbi:MAG: hypothetical protein ACAH80_04710 [Alphaproteobacteria bacterium]
MKYPFFLFLIWTIALFHVWEHRRFIEELRRLQRVLADFNPVREATAEKLKGHDWRIVSLDGTKLGLRRAFMVKDAFSAARYAMPVLFVALSLLVLESWSMAGAYLAGVIIKWFVTKTVLELSPANPRYDVRLLGVPLFGEPLPDKGAERTLLGMFKKKKD